LPGPERSGRSIAGELLENGHEVLLIDKNPTSISVERVPQAEWLLADALRDHLAGRSRAAALQRGDRRDR